jgi:mRNA (guanine-N7-)-methyltransferase
MMSVQHSLSKFLASNKVVPLSNILSEYATNFHKFYEERRDPTKYTRAHNALYNMKVLNRNGSISAQEWDVSRMYVAVKFRKIKESQIEVGGEDVGPDEMIDPN